LTYVLFTKESCPFCTVAKNLLEKEQEVYVAYDIDEHPSIKSFLLDSGLKTVPQIFDNGYHVGGCDSLIDYLARFNGSTD
jgi:glutaredoxin 3